MLREHMAGVHRALCSKPRSSLAVSRGHRETASELRSVGLTVRRYGNSNRSHKRDAYSDADGHSNCNGNRSRYSNA